MSAIYKCAVGTHLLNHVPHVLHDASVDERLRRVHQNHRILRGIQRGSDIVEGSLLAVAQLDGAVGLIAAVVAEQQPTAFAQNLVARKYDLPVAHQRVELGVRRLGVVAIEAHARLVDKQLGKLVAHEHHQQPLELGSGFAAYERIDGKLLVILVLDASGHGVMIILRENALQCRHSVSLVAGILQQALAKATFTGTVGTYHRHLRGVVELKRFADGSFGQCNVHIIMVFMHNCCVLRNYIFLVTPSTHK